MDGVSKTRCIRPRCRRTHVYPYVLGCNIRTCHWELGILLVQRLKSYMMGIAAFRETDLLEDRFESEMRLLKATASILFTRLYDTLLARLLTTRTSEHLLRICPLLFQALTLDKILSKQVSDGTQDIQYHLSDLPWGKSSPGSQKGFVGRPARRVHHLSVPLSALR